jgi:hypothetical protein
MLSRLRIWESNSIPTAPTKTQCFRGFRSAKRYRSTEKYLMAVKVPIRYSSDVTYECDIFALYGGLR